MKRLLEEIERTLPEGGDWCTLAKANTLAAIVVGLRPRRVVEIGVWMGGSLVPMLLAMKYVRDELGGDALATATAIDPWSPTASMAGEDGPNADWWGTVDHEHAFSAFRARLEKHVLMSLCVIERRRSDEVLPPHPIDLIHIDGNHREQAVRDVERFCPHVRLGGIAILDDVGWEGGHVARGVDIARTLGFIDLYPVERGLVMQRRWTEG